MRNSKPQAFPYFKFYPRDWLEKTRFLTPAERGIYIDIIALTMKNEGVIENDDARMAYDLNISSRLWRTIRDALVEKGKITLSDGTIINDRCLTELEALMSERQKRSEAATVREAGRRTRAPKTEDEYPSEHPLFAAGSLEVQPRTPRESSTKVERKNAEPKKKINEINATRTTAVVQSCHYLDLDSDSSDSKGNLKVPLTCPKPAVSHGAAKVLSLLPDETEPAPQDGVRMNGVAINGPNGLTVPFETIDAAARARNVPTETARDLVMGRLVALVANSIAIKDPAKEVATALKGHKHTRSGRRAYTVDFEWWWKRYPHPEGKAEAFDEWEKLSAEDRHDAAEGLVRQRAKLQADYERISQDGARCCPHARKWLKARRWESRVDEVKKVSSKLAEMRKIAETARG